MSSPRRRKVLKRQKKKNGDGERIQWKHLQVQRDYFDRLSKDLQLKELDDWYRVKVSEVRKRKGSVLLSRYYNDSLFQALSSVYPEYNRQPWKFDTTFQKWSGDPQLIRKYMEWLAGELNVKNLDDWYSVTLSDIKLQGGSKI